MAKRGFTTILSLEEVAALEKQGAVKYSTLNGREKAVMVYEERIYHRSWLEPNNYIYIGETVAGIRRTKANEEAEETKRNNARLGQTSTG